MRWHWNKIKLYLPALIPVPFSSLKYVVLLAYVYQVPHGEDGSFASPLINYVMWMFFFFQSLPKVNHTIRRFCASFAYSHSTSASTGVKLACDWYGLTRKISLDGWLDIVKRSTAHAVDFSPHWKVYCNNAEFKVRGNWMIFLNMCASLSPIVVPDTSSDTSIETF